MNKKGEEKMVKTTDNKTIFRYRIELVTNTDVLDFCKTASKLRGDVFLVGPNMKLNAKSFLGIHVARISWNKLEVESELDCYNDFKRFIV